MQGLWGEEVMAWRDKENIAEGSHMPQEEVTVENRTQPEHDYGAELWEPTQDLRHSIEPPSSPLLM